MPRGAVRVVQPAPVGRKADAVRNPDAAVQLHGYIRGVQTPQFARHPDGELERVGAERADQHPALGVREQVVEARHVRLLEQDASLTVVDVADVLSGNDQPARGVQRNAADAAASRNHGRDLAIRVAAIHAAVRHVAEIQIIVRVHARAFEQSVAGRQRLEHVSPGVVCANLRTGYHSARSANNTMGEAARYPFAPSLSPARSQRESACGKPRTWTIRAPIFTLTSPDGDTDKGGRI